MVVARRPAVGPPAVWSGFCGYRKDLRSLQLLDSSVTESAMTAVATLGSTLALAAVALKFPWM